MYLSIQLIWIKRKMKTLYLYFMKHISALIFYFEICNRKLSILPRVTWQLYLGRQHWGTPASAGRFVVEVVSTTGLERVWWRVSPSACPFVALYSSQSFCWDRDGLCMFPFLSGVHYLHYAGFPPLHATTLRLHRGAGRVSVLVREGITEPCVWMDWGEKEPGGSARQSLSAASITPIVSHVSSMQWEESAQVLPHTNRRRRGRSGGIFMGYLLDFHHPVVLNLCSGWGRSRSCWKPPGPGMWLWWRNCWVERKEYWGQALVPSHYPTY